MIYCIFLITQSPLHFFQHLLFYLSPSMLDFLFPCIYMPPAHFLSLSSSISGFQKTTHPSLSEPIKQQHSWFWVSLVYWSLTIPLNGSERWQDLSGCRAAEGVTRGLQLGKATPGASGSFGLFNKGCLIMRLGCLQFFQVLILISAIQSYLVTVLYFLYCLLETNESMWVNTLKVHKDRRK